jgi:translation initiation factor IF-3
MIRRRIFGLLAKSRNSFYIRNNDIIFDQVKVIDTNGKVLGEMSTSEGIEIAKSKGLDLVLVEFESDPPVCHIGDSVPQKDEIKLDPNAGYSFDPTLRLATIRFSVCIDELEMERKIDILRKHLLEKRRCEVVVFFKENQARDREALQEVFVKILKECQDIAKSPDSGELLLEANESKIRLWPCNPDQTEPLFSQQFTIQSEEIPEELRLEEKGHPRKFRYVRARIDPRLIIRDKHSRDSD